jgi:hypothetical protein
MIVPGFGFMSDVAAVCPQGRPGPPPLVVLTFTTVSPAKPATARLSGPWAFSGHPFNGLRSAADRIGAKGRRRIYRQGENEPLTQPTPPTSRTSASPSNRDRRPGMPVEGPFAFYSARDAYASSDTAGDSPG